jgi:hypothetical protein
MTPATTSAAGQDGAGLLPARPLAAQAHALRAAAAFIERTGLKGLSVTADSDGIYISVPRSAGSPATRTGTVTYLAVLTGAPCPRRRDHQAWAWVATSGRIAGHDAHISTTIEPGEQETA